MATSDTATFRIAPIPRKGLGVIAARRIEAGECILDEPPLLVLKAPRSAESFGTDAFHATFKELDSLVAALSEEKKKAFWQLCDVHGSLLAYSLYDEGREQTALGILKSNAYILEVGDAFAPSEETATRCGVFPMISRINHSCRPCAHTAWNPTRRRQTVHALRLIDEGEEICVSYVDGALSEWDGTRTARRAELLRFFRFQCDCDACALCGSALAQSDARRRRLHQLQSTPTTADGQAMDATVEELWALAAAEELPAVWLRFVLVRAMRRCEARGDRARALQWAERGLASARLALGNDAPTTSKFEARVKALRAQLGGGAALPAPPRAPDEARGSQHDPSARGGTRHDCASMLQLVVAGGDGRSRWVFTT